MIKNEEALDNYYDKLNKHLSILKSIRYWTKFTPVRLFSENIEGVFYEVKRYKNIIFYEIREDGIFKINILKFLNKILESVEDEKKKNDFLNLKLQFQEFVVSLEIKTKEGKSILNEVYNIPKFKDKIILIYTKNFNEEMFFENREQLEDYLDENLEKFEKLEIDDKEISRPQILTQEYQEHEYKKLLENEEYEMLDYITKINKKYGG